MATWASHPIFDPITEADIQKELLWHNSSIQIAGNTICWQRWESAGIRHINDLLHHTEPRFLSHEEVNANYGVNTSFLQILQIRSAIPFLWRTKLLGQATQDLTIHPTIVGDNDQYLDLTKANSKKIYSLLILSKRPQVTSQRKWNLSFPVDDESLHDYWAAIYKRPYKNARDTKLQAFQFRIIHRTLPCNKFLSNIRILPTDSCTFCHSTDTIEHFLFHCPQTKAFWENLCTWFDREVDIQLTVSTRALLFGISDDAPNARVVNFLLLFVKFIFTGRSFSTRAHSQQYTSLGSYGPGFGWNCL